MKPNVAWIGLGIMGEPMASHVIAAGFPLTVWSRSPGKAAGLTERGARAAPSARQAVADADVVVTMLSTPDALDQVLTGADGILDGLRAGSVLVDMGTSGTAVAMRAADLAARNGASFVDAPVLGSRVPAEQGKLVVMAGGAPTDVERVRPVLETTAKSFHHVGPVGSGQSMKLAANLLLAHLLSGLAGSVALAKGLGLAPSDLVDILESGIGPTYFRGKGNQMVSGNFVTQFSVDLIRKDLRLIRHALDDSGVPVPTIGPILGLFDEAARRGWGGEDCSVVVKVLGKLDPK